MSEPSIPTDEPFWVRLLKATVYSALGFMIPLTWAAIVAVLNQHSDAWTAETAEVFNLVGNFMGLAGLVCFIVVTVELMGPHHVNWKIRKLSSELWTYLSGVTSG